MLALQVHDFRLELLERLVACRHRPAQTFDLGFRLAVIGGLLECPRILLPQPLRQLHGVCIGVRNIHQQLRQHDSDSAGQAGCAQLPLRPPLPQRRNLPLQPICTPGFVLQVDEHPPAVHRLILERLLQLLHGRLQLRV